MFLLFSKRKRSEHDEETERQIQAIRQPVLDKMDEANKSLAKVNKSLTKTNIRYITEALSHATGGDRR